MSKHQRPSTALPLLDFLQLELDAVRARRWREHGNSPRRREGVELDGAPPEPWLTEWPRFGREPSAAEIYGVNLRLDICDEVAARLYGTPPQTPELAAWGRQGGLGAPEMRIDADMWRVEPLFDPAKGSVTFEASRQVRETWYRVHIARARDIGSSATLDRDTSAASKGKSAAKAATWREIAKHARACRDKVPSDWAAMTQKERHLAVLKRAGHTKPPRGWSLETVQRVIDDPDFMN